MECNKDDANKAKVISERKLSEKDYTGAKKFALKAQALYPGIEGISQLMMTIDIYITAEKKINGEVDWYGILGVTPNADDEIIRKQYRKLALILHPDKNKSTGADGAFKLISEGWSLLSDKAKRLAYNQKRSLDGVNNFANKSSSNVRPPNTAPQGNFNHVPRPINSFWTTCQTCKMHYEYLKIHLNQTLLCSRCRQPFKAIETAPPAKFSKASNSVPQNKPQKPAPNSNFSKPPNSIPSQNHKKPVPNANYSKPPNSVPQNRPQKPAPSSNFPRPPNTFPQQNNQMPYYNANIRNPTTAPNVGIRGFGSAKFPNFPFNRNGPMGPTVSSHSVAAKAANVVMMAHERMKREREEAYRAGSWEKRARYEYMSTRELTTNETRDMLTKKAKTDILKKLIQLNSESLTKASNSKKVNTSDVKQRANLKADNHKLNKNEVINSTTGGDQDKKSSTKISTEPEKEDAEINVPDPDFYEFDQDRMENSFEENQIWAAYDDDDGMPRFYAFVHKVISLKPFKMRISWLESNSNAEISNMKWVGCGFYKSCGEYKLGKPELTKSLNSFSHKVKWVKGLSGSIRIFPEKGEVWAIYRNWSRDWNELTPDEVIHKYDIVEVFEEYNEEKGISIAPLEKVSGFRTVFRTLTGPEYIQKLPKEEMLRFSHRIPNHLLTGEEAKNAPKGLQELDPASTPLELIQLVTEENKMQGNEKKKMNI